jgi:pyrimidine deaminase RibD-like protein
MKLAIEEARKSVSEQDGKPHPKVGAVVVKKGSSTGRLLGLLSACSILIRESQVAGCWH